MRPASMADNPFLRDLTPAQQNLLAQLFVPADLVARGVIFRQGQEATFMYILVEGGVAIRYKPYDGPRMTLTRLHVGDVFGWSSVLGNTVYTADAIATSPARILRARGSEIRSVCTQYSITGSQILEKLALAVSPRWLHSREQIQDLLKQEMLETDARASRRVSAGRPQPAPLSAQGSQLPRERIGQRVRSHAPGPVPLGFSRKVHPCLAAQLKKILHRD